jgi:hypothetical protein
MRAGIIIQLPGVGNFRLRWGLGASEHCPTCLVRADVWSDLEVTNGVLGPYSRVGTFA